MAFAHENIIKKNFSKITITLASSDLILSRSHGEVTKPETINYRSFRPEKDGLFCEKIFGPVRDWECHCGKYKRIRYKGIICDRCGVEVTQKSVRRERMGHISLAVPIVHIWYFRSTPSKIGNILGLRSKDLEKVIYYESYVVVQPGTSGLHQMDLLSEEQYYDVLESLPEKNQDLDDTDEKKFIAKIGGQAIKELLKHSDVESIAADLRAHSKMETSVQKKDEILKRLRVVEAFRERENGPVNKPEWLVLDVIPVSPPELRPLVPLEGGRFATSDLNDLYRRVIIRNNRLKRLIEIKAPEVILRNEKRMLQEAVDSLFDNSRRVNAVRSDNNRALKSLSDMLKGKQGRFRQNLLGKRVDYSGRSVIVVGPELKLHECGLPKDMAVELFKPFIIRKLIERGLVKTVKSAKKMVDKKGQEVWEILEHIIDGHPVLLNRAPTLHRLGIQAFEPVLIEGKAIQLHPLVCTAFNADFDGDQMAVHVPLSLEAQLEARVLMMSTNNILSPANGKPIIVPSQDIVLGLYHITMEREGEKGEGMMFTNVGEIEQALEAKAVTLHARVKARYDGVDENGEPVVRRVETTPGRMLLSEILPRHQAVQFELINQLLTKKEISNLIDHVYRFCGQKETVIFCDRLMTLGFTQACKAGISFGKDDLIIPEAKHTLVAEVQEKVKEYEQQYQDGLITQREKYNKEVDAWTSCSEKVAEEMIKVIRTQKPGEPINSVWMMSDSGARGSAAQIKQLAGMRGLMTKPSGEIISTPIISNFKEGLTVLEYFNSTHGARKGLADTALKTANSGYLTRRLVDVAQDAIITEEDCGTTRGLSTRAVIDGGEIISPLADRILGRCAAVDVLDPLSGEVVLPAAGLIDEDAVDAIERAGIDTVSIRSVLTCEARQGVCGKCYGRDLARGTVVNMGEAVGVIAAQSIGEPGTQLTMRTFHIGGAAQRGAEQSSIEAVLDAKVEVKNRNVVINSSGLPVVMGRNCEMVLLDDAGREKARHRVPYGARLLADEGIQVKRGDRLAEWDPYTIPIITEKDGVAHYVDVIDGVSMREVVDEATGISSKVVIDWKQTPRGGDLRPRMALRDERGEVLMLANGLEARYFLPVDAILSIENGVLVKAGDVLARIPRESSKTRDITGGLPRVAELFEARKPKDFAIISESEGRVEFGKDYKTKRRILVVPSDGDAETVEYLIPKGKHLSVQEGDYVQKGDLMMDGNLVPHDILRVLGVEELASYLINEIQEVYRLQGVRINDKHIEVIVRQMLQKVEIEDPGETTFLSGEQVDRTEFDLENRKSEIEDLRLAAAHPVLQGITKASLQTSSFISAASFQETTRVLTEAAVSGRIDALTGLKENVIVGRLIPAGTGSVIARLREIAADRDRELAAIAAAAEEEPAQLEAEQRTA